MKRIEYASRDKSTYGPGPWQDEPDKRQWMDEATGLPCLIVRNHFGALCGYVGVPSEHPFYGADYDRLNEEDIDVHNGLSFSAKCHEGGSEESAICHKVEPGEPDDVWWFGFEVQIIRPGLRSLYIGTVRELARHLRVITPRDPTRRIDRMASHCLCPIDVPASAKASGYVVIDEPMFFPDIIIQKEDTLGQAHGRDHRRRRSDNRNSRGRQASEKA